MSKIVFVFVAVYFGLALLVYVKQRDLMFAPSLERVLPRDVGLVNVEEITLTTQTGLRLYSWYGPAEADQPTILFFHGNGQGVSQRQVKFRELMAKGYGVFMLGYPGYGGSDGSPSEAAFIDAAVLSYDWLVKNGIAPTDVVIYGESLGSAVGVQLAALKQARALILEAPMSSVRDIAQSLYPYFPVRLLLKDPFLSVNHIGQVNDPLLVIHGTADEVIPIASGRKLFERANQPKTFLAIEGGGHNNLYDFPVVAALHSFLSSGYVGHE